MDLIDTIEKPEDMRKMAQWSLFSKKRINRKELPLDFRKPKKSNPWRVTTSMKDDYCGIPSLQGQLKRALKIRPQLRTGAADNNLLVDWAAFKRRLYRLSPVTGREITFIINLLFHEILEVMKAGYGVRVPHFGTFYAQHTTSVAKRKYNPASGELKIFTKPSDWKVMHTVKPTYYPDSYTSHVLAKKEHMRLSYRRYQTTAPYGTLTYWKRTMESFLSRRAVLRSQQMDLIGFGDSVLQKVTKQPLLNAKRLKLHAFSRKSIKNGHDTLLFSPVERTKEMQEWLQDYPDAELVTVTPDIHLLADIKKKALRSIFTHTRIKPQDLLVLEDEGRLEEVFGDNKEALRQYLTDREDRTLEDLRLGSEEARQERILALSDEEREQFEAKREASRIENRKTRRKEALKKLKEIEELEPDKASLDYIFGRPSAELEKLKKLASEDEVEEKHKQLLLDAGVDEQVLKKREPLVKNSEEE